MLLELHERRRRDESVYNDRSPADFTQLFVHFVDVWNLLEIDPCFLEPGDVGRMRYFGQEIQVSTHHIAPYGVILWRVLFVMLADNKLA